MSVYSRSISIIITFIVIIHDGASGFAKKMANKK
ncbi:Uncharacterised protein [Phocoenobacter uteri]|uniref:Uncharacterized protein n=1 Tax=Phocoenobacter uteri TaxID=146806 RepID=A0A379C8C7_9PAST|nr:Uncharacterised protein [Phocoenobacter uteri]